MSLYVLFYFFFFLRQGLTPLPYISLKVVVLAQSPESWDDKWEPQCLAFIFPIISDWNYDFLCLI